MVDLQILTSISPPPAAPEVPDFRLIRRDACLRSLQRSSPLMPILEGDVAECAGRLVARWPTAFGWAYCALPPDADLDHRPRAASIRFLSDGRRVEDPSSGDHNLTNGFVVLNPFGEIESRLNGWHGRPWPEVDLETAADRELKRFVAEWPSVAARLGVAVPTDDERLFPLGKIRRQPDVPPGVAVDWAAFLRRHASGDFGVNGDFIDVPLTTGEVFALGLQLPDVQARAAVQSGHGLIRSKYRLEGSEFFLTVLTALAPGRSETIAFLERA